MRWLAFPTESLRASHSFTAWNLFRIAPGLAWLCILLTFWLLGHPNAIPLSRWYLVGCLVCGLPFLIVVNRKLQGPLKPDARLAPEMLRFGIPSAITSIPLTINLQFDQMLIIAFLPARSLGLYAIAVSWSGGVAPLLQALGTVLFPHVSAERDTDRQGHLLATALQSGALVAVATSVPFMLLAPFALPWFSVQPSVHLYLLHSCWSPPPRSFPGQGSRRRDCRASDVQPSSWSLKQWQPWSLSPHCQCFFTSMGSLAPP